MYFVYSLGMPCPSRTTECGRNCLVLSHAFTSVGFVQNLLYAEGSVLQELTFQVSQGYCQSLRGTASMDPSLICASLPNLAGHPGSRGTLLGICNAPSYHTNKTLEDHAASKSSS